MGMELSVIYSVVTNPAVGCHYLPPATDHHHPLASTKLYCLVT